MQSLSGSSAQKGAAAVFGALAAAAATLIGAVLAIVFAASVVVIGLMAAVVIGLVAMATRARRAARVRASQDPNLIVARRVGGHSWVAYGWDGQRQG